MRATGFSYWTGIARDTLCLANEAADVAARTFNCFNKAPLAKQLSRSVALSTARDHASEKSKRTRSLGTYATALQRGGTFVPALLED